MRAFFKDFKNPRFLELFSSAKHSMDRDWWYFGRGEAWGDKCERCLDAISRTDPHPPAEICPEMIDCWKIELWESNLHDLEQVLIYLMERSRADKNLIGKMSLGHAVWHEPRGDRLGSGNSHSIPEEAKPNDYLSGKLKHDRVILIYCRTIEERERRREKIYTDLWLKGLYRKNTLPPYRRGTIKPHEDLFGPWEKWYDMDKDYTPSEKTNSKK